MSVEIYDALRDAGGVSEEKARKAAEAVAGIGGSLAAIDAIKLSAVFRTAGINVVVIAIKELHAEDEIAATYFVN